MTVNVLYGNKSFNRSADVEVDGNSVAYRGDEAIEELQNRYDCDNCGPIIDLENGSCPNCMGKEVRKSPHVITNEQLETLEQLGAVGNNLNILIAEDGSMTAEIRS